MICLADNGGHIDVVEISSNGRSVEIAVLELIRIASRHISMRSIR